MKDLLDRMKVFDRPATDEQVESVMWALGSEVSIALMEGVLKAYKAARKKILEGDLLDWMQENDQTTFETDDVKVSIKTYVSAKIEDGQTEVAFQWLEENEYGDLIKDTLQLAKGEFTAEVEKSLEDLGVSYTQTQGIHPQTLKKVIVDRLAAEDTLPTEDDGFKIHYHDECNVKEL